ncbi:MAG: hypothetical protein U0694_07545 [Anaerolineae bacterium]
MLCLMWLDRRRGLLPLIVCWLAAFVGMFSHENGVMLVPLLQLALVVYGWRSWFTRRMALLALPLLALTGVYLLLCFKLPSCRAAATGVDGHDSHSLAVALQGLIYPVAALVRRLTLSDAHTAADCAGGRRGRGRLGLAGRRYILPLLCGVGWYLLAALPTLLFLQTDCFKVRRVCCCCRRRGRACSAGAAVYGAWVHQQRWLRYAGRTAGVLLLLNRCAAGRRLLRGGARSWKR